MGEIRKTDDGDWEVVVTQRAASREVAARLLARLEDVVDYEYSDRRRLPSVGISGTESAEVQLVRAVAYLERMKRNGDGAVLVPVLVAIRTGRMQWHMTHWKGGTSLASKFPGVLSVGEVSKAATVLREELGELLDRRLPLNEALDNLLEWFDHDSLQAAYGRYLAKRQG
jgi:hypothetical protein